MNLRRTLVASTTAALLLIAPAASFARHGADDGPRHDRNDDRTSQRHGDDDGPRHDRGDDHGRHHRGHHRHGSDDGPRHH